MLGIFSVVTYDIFIGQTQLIPTTRTVGEDVFLRLQSADLYGNLQIRGPAEANDWTGVDEAKWDNDG